MTDGAQIRSVFSEGKQIDRPIEKVIDYYRNDETQLREEVEEYEATEQVEGRLRQFVEAYREGASGANVTQTGIWVSGFYGSGKSSFTKYVGLALDPNRCIGGRPFREFLVDRLHSNDVKSLIQSTAKTYPAAVVFLDLGSEQIADSATATVAHVLYGKVLQWAGFSHDPKIAQLEFLLDDQGKYEAFVKAYDEAFPGKGGWLQVHNTPLLAIPRADKLLPRFLPDEYPDEGKFRQTRFDERLTVEDVARRMIGLARKRGGCEQVIFLVDEAGQYVAARAELILNLDGLARAIKEIGRGKAWIVGTGQQTLNEVVERAMYNSAELGKLRDRFPIDIHLDAADIRVITYRRLLTKSRAGEKALRDLYGSAGAKLPQFTKLTEWTATSGELHEDTFVQLYPFLPQHFEILLRLIRGLARTTGGIGLRSAIRVVQDLLVDATHVLPADVIALASRSLGTLVCVDDFYDSLRTDIQRQYSFVVDGVGKVEQLFPGQPLMVRVASLPPSGRSMPPLRPAQVGLSERNLLGRAVADVAGASHHG